MGKRHHDVPFLVLARRDVRDRRLFCFLGMFKIGQVAVVDFPWRFRVGCLCDLTVANRFRLRNESLCRVWRNLYSDLSAITVGS